MTFDEALVFADHMYEDGAAWGARNFCGFLVENKVLEEGQASELLRDYRGDQAQKSK